MKTKILVLLLIVSKFIFINGQMDDKFYFPGKEMKPIEWANQKEIKFAVDKDTINAVILKPIKDAKATVFYFHGAGGNVSSYAPLLTPLLQDNFQIILVDFRGYGKSTGIPTHQNIATDGEKVFTEMSKMDEIKNTKIIIYGASIGSQIAALLAKNHESQISGLVLEGTISSFGDIAAFYAPEYKEMLEKSYVSPYSAKEDIKSLKKIPKLFIHSKEDKDVPFTQGMMVYNNAPEPKEFIEFNGKHLYGLLHESLKILVAMNKMIAENPKK